MRSSETVPSLAHLRHGLQRGVRPGKMEWCNIEGVMATNHLRFLFLLAIPLAAGAAAAEEANAQPAPAAVAWDLKALAKPAQDVSGQRTDGQGRDVDLL